MVPGPMDDDLVVAKTRVVVVVVGRLGNVKYFHFAGCISVYRERTNDSGDARLIDRIAPIFRIVADRTSFLFPIYTLGVPGLNLDSEVTCRVHAQCYYMRCNTIRPDEYLCCGIGKWVPFDWCDDVEVVCAHTLYRKCLRANYISHPFHVLYFSFAHSYFRSQTSEVHETSEVIVLFFWFISFKSI